MKGTSKRTRESQKRALLMLSAFVMAANVFLSGCGDKNEPELQESVSTSYVVSTQQPVPDSLYTLAIETLTEQDEMIVVDTTYGTVCYPFAFSDIITVEAENYADNAMLAFYGNLGNERVRLFSLAFNGDEGTLLGHVTISDCQEPVSVYMLIHTPDELLSEEEQATFFAAQECVNDVITALEENDGFLAAE